MDSKDDGDGPVLNKHQKEQIEKFKANMNVMVAHRKALNELLEQKLKEINKTLKNI